MERETRRQRYRSLMSGWIHEAAVRWRDRQHASGASPATWLNLSPRVSLAQSATWGNKAVGIESLTQWTGPLSSMITGGCTLSRSLKEHSGHGVMHAHMQPCICCNSRWLIQCISTFTLKIHQVTSVFGASNLLFILNTLWSRNGSHTLLHNDISFLCSFNQCYSFNKGLWLKKY